MTDPETLPESDCVANAPHPRFSQTMFGQHTAQADFLSAFRQTRLHHAWLLGGARGIGKATLAWHIARFMLAQQTANPPNDTLILPPDHPINPRIHTLADPRLFLLRRAYDTKKATFQSRISIDDIRKLTHFFSLSTPDGGWRVAVIDTPDELSPNGANALLKILEEPPERSLFLLISHKPAFLLPTIRSRCCVLRCAPLPDETVQTALQQMNAPLPESESERRALHLLAKGSLGEAWRLLNGDGIALYRQIVGLMGKGSPIPRAALLDFVGMVTERGNTEKTAMAHHLLHTFVSRVSHFGVDNAGFSPITEQERTLFAQLCPNLARAQVWAQALQDIIALQTQAEMINLDPHSIMLDTFLHLDKTIQN